MARGEQAGMEREVLASLFCAFILAVVVVEAINIGPCVARCMKELGPRAGMRCVALCSVNSDAF